MDKLLQHIQHANAYIDVTVLATATKDENLKTLRATLVIMRSANFKLSAKRDILERRIIFLGHDVSANGFSQATG